MEAHYRHIHFHLYCMGSPQVCHMGSKDEFVDLLTCRMDSVVEIAGGSQSCHTGSEAEPTDRLVVDRMDSVDETADCCSVVYRMDSVAVVETGSWVVCRKDSCFAHIDCRHMDFLIDHMILHSRPGCYCCCCSTVARVSVGGRRYLWICLQPYCSRVGGFR